jgi:hypothetical protein
MIKIDVVNKRRNGMRFKTERPFSPTEAIRFKLAQAQICFRSGFRSSEFYAE